MAKIGEGSVGEVVHRTDLEKFVDLGGLSGMLVGETSSTGRDGGMGGWRFVGSI